MVRSMFKFLKLQTYLCPLLRIVLYKLFTANSLLGLAMVMPSHTLAGNNCEPVFKIDASLSQSGRDFLIKNNANLHQDPAVKRASSNSNSQKPADIISHWITYLESMYNSLQNKPSQIKQIKNIFYHQYVIKPSDVPQSYFDFQVRIARERGHGNVEMTDHMKTQLIETLILDQQRSLDRWIEYLTSPDTRMYPVWAKFWMFKGMVKLSKFNFETNSFGSRTKETVAPFAELNREALGYVMDLIVRKVNKSEFTQIADKELQILLDGASFAKMYAYALKKAGFGTNQKFITNDGKWIKYSQGSDHIPLVKSLEGKNTGWCTAAVSTAKTQLHAGDFHVYYSLDERGQASVPRIAIRMSGENIEEVRGVGKDQHLDSQIADSNIIQTKMKEFGEQGEQYAIKEQDMKLLTTIERKSKLGEPLNKTELRFLYELNRKIMGFGYEPDPRINKIKSMRLPKKDLIVIFDHKLREDEISTTSEEAIRGKSKFHYGNLFLRRFSSPTRLELPEVVHGDLDLRNLKSAKGLKFPKTVNGSLDLSKLTSETDLVLPETVNGDLLLHDLTSASRLKLPETVNGDLYLHNLKSADGLTLPKTVNGYLDLSGLTSAVETKFPKLLNGSLNLSKLSSAPGLKLPETVNGDLLLNGLTSAAGLKMPKTVNGDLYFRSLSSAAGLQLPETLNGSLYMRGLTTAVGLKLPKTVDGTLDLSALTSAVGLKLPEVVTGDLNLKNLSPSNGLVFPKVVGGTLYFNGTQRQIAPLGLIL